MDMNAIRGHLQAMLSHMSRPIWISTASDQDTTDPGVASTYGSIQGVIQVLQVFN